MVTNFLMHLKSNVKMSSTPGIAARLCMMNGNWAEPNILECESQQFYDLRLQVTSQCMLFIILYIDKQLTVIRFLKLATCG